MQDRAAIYYIQSCLIVQFERFAYAARMRLSRLVVALALPTLAMPAVALIDCAGGAPLQAPPTSPTDSQSAITAGVSAGATPVAPTAAGSSSGSTAVAVAGVPSATPSGALSGTAPAPPEDPNLACGAVSSPFEQQIRPEIKKCFFDAMKTNQKLSGNVKLVVHVGPKGRIQAVNVIDAKELGPGAVACMTKVVKSATFDTSPCKDRQIQMPMAFGNAAREKK